MFRVLVLLIFFFFASFAVAIDLSESYRSALSYNADYLAAIADNDAGAENEVIGRSVLLPQISANAAINEIYLNGFGASSMYHQPTIGANVSQVVFDFSKFSQFTKSKYQTQLAKFKLQNAQQQLIINVATAYFDVLYSIDNLAAIQMQKSAFERQLRQAQKSFDVGTVTVADVNDAQSSYDSVTAQEIQAENDLLNKKTIFRNLTGVNPDQIQPLMDNIGLVTPTPTTADAWSGIAQASDLNIKMAALQVAMAEEDISIAKSGHMPTVNALGSFSYQGEGTAEASINQDPSTFGEYTQASVGLSVTMPLYAGGGVSSQTRQAIASLEASQQKLSSTTRQTDQNIRNAFWQVQNGVNFVKAQQQAVKSAALKLKSDKLGYEVGLRTSIDLVNSEKNYANVLLSYNQSRYSYLNYRLQLKYLAGLIDASYLAEINADIKK